jgi:hypothetical protein
VRRRPRRSNSSKTLYRELSTACTAYESRSHDGPRLILDGISVPIDTALAINWHKSRKDRFNAHAAEANNTEAFAWNAFWNIKTANLFLAEFGIQLIVNKDDLVYDDYPRVFHVYEEWPGAIWHRRSGSIYKDGVWRDGPSSLTLHPGRSERGTVSRGRAFVFTRPPAGIGAAWLDDGPAGDVLRHLKGQALDKGAPVPFWKQSRLHRDAIRDNGGLFGGDPQEKRQATNQREKHNAEIIALRDADPRVVADWLEYERRELLLDELIGSRKTAHEAYVHQVLKSAQKKPADWGHSSGAAGDCFRLNPKNWIVTDQIHRRWYWNGAWRTCPVVVRRGDAPDIGVTDIAPHKELPPQTLVTAFLRRPRLATGDVAGEYLLWRDRLPERPIPKFKTVRRAFLFETAEQIKTDQIDKSNTFDQTNAGRDFYERFFSLGLDSPKAEPEKPTRSGLAARMLRKELKKQGIKAKIIDVPERAGLRIRPEKPLAPIPIAHDPWRHYYDGEKVLKGVQKRPPDEDPWLKAA